MPACWTVLLLLGSLLSALAPTRSVTNRAGAMTRYGYDSRGNLSDIFPPSGRRPLHNSYNTDNRLVETLDALGKKVSYSYGSGNTTITDRAGKSQTITYDGYGSVTGTSQNVTGYQLDPNGNPVLTNGNPTPQTQTLSSSLSYNTQGAGLPPATDNPDLPTQVTDPLGRVTSYSYNEWGDVTHVKDALGNITQYEYNGYGEVTKVYFKRS